MSDIPNVQIVMPECPVCEEELELTGEVRFVGGAVAKAGLACSGCDISWNLEGKDGELESYAPQCQSMRSDRQCALALDHTGLHLCVRDGDSVWTWSE